MPKKAALIFTAILFSVVIIYFAAVEKAEEKEITTPKQTAFGIVSEISDLDTDGDGLNDWEEGLWNSDPNNIDTDGDGTNDNDEVKAGRNPIVAGPDDLLSTSINFFDNTESIHTEDTEIDILGRNLFTDYLELKKTDSLSSSNEQKLVEKLINENSTSFNFSEYTINSIKIVPDSAESEESYKTSIDSVFEEFSKVKENELVVLTEALSTGDEKEFQKLDYSIQIYSGAIETLLVTEVPTSARYAHTDLLNGINYFTQIIKDMRDVENNAVSAIAAVNGYFDAESYLLEVFNELNTYFKDKGLNQ